MSNEFVFYIYDDDADDPRFGFWLETEEGGMSLYERPPDGEGKWLDPDGGGDYDGVEPTDDLKNVIRALFDDGIDGATVADLPPHERHFVQVIHGTNAENPGAIPAPVWHWMNDVAAEVS